MNYILFKLNVIIFLIFLALVGNYFLFSKSQNILKKTVTKSFQKYKYSFIFFTMVFICLIYYYKFKIFSFKKQNLLISNNAEPFLSEILKNTNIDKDMFIFLIIESLILILFVSFYLYHRTLKYNDREFETFKLAYTIFTGKTITKITKTNLKQLEKCVIAANKYITNELKADPTLNNTVDITTLQINRPFNIHDFDNSIETNTNFTKLYEIYTNYTKIKQKKDEIFNILSTFCDDDIPIPVNLADFNKIPKNICEKICDKLNFQIQDIKIKYNGNVINDRAMDQLMYKLKQKNLTKKDFSELLSFKFDNNTVITPKLLNFIKIIKFMSGNIIFEPNFEPKISSKIQYIKERKTPLPLFLKEFEKLVNEYDVPLLPQENRSNIRHELQIKLTDTVQYFIFLKTISTANSNYFENSCIPFNAYTQIDTFLEAFSNLNKRLEKSDLSNLNSREITKYLTELQAGISFLNKYYLKARKEIDVLKQQIRNLEAKNNKPLTKFIGTYTFERLMQLMNI